MATVADVAVYILNAHGPMTAMKLQKLVYYSQAWSLVWDSKPLFDDTIEAWANGPVCPALYHLHTGEFLLDKKAMDLHGKQAALTQSEVETVASVLASYGDKSPQWLSDLTHKEAPWLDARKDKRAGERGNTVISPAAMAEYYEGL